MSKTLLFVRAKPAPTRKAKVVDHFGGPLPAHLAPSTWVRRWDQAVAHGACAAGVVGCAAMGIGAMGWTALGWGQSVGAVLARAGTLMVWLFTEGRVCGADGAHLWSDAHLRAQTLGLVMASSVLALGAGAWAWGRGLRLQNAVRHLRGAQHRVHQAAIEGFQRNAKQLGLTLDNAFLAIHPSARWPVSQWKKHILVSGAVGSGKTVLLVGWLKQIIEANHKLFLYDIKGDFTQLFAGEESTGVRRAALLSPFDARSLVWDIAKDVQTPLQAAAFAQSMIPVEEGNGRYWSTSAQMLLEGAVLALQHDKPGQWGFFDLKQQLEQGREAFAKSMATHKPKAYNLIAEEGQAASSVMGTLSAYTRTIDLLAEAWPRPRKGKSIALSDWLQDDFKGPRQLIVQAGIDQELSSTLIASMVDVCASTLIGPQMPDDEAGRHVFFVLDEFTSLKPMRITDLIDKGRSKGACVILLYQADSQIEARYGQATATALVGMVGTHIICKQLASETRQHLCQLAGQRRVAVLHSNVSGGFKDGVALSTSVTEELWDVLTPSDLSELGPVFKGKHFEGIKALLTTGGDYYELLFPPTRLSKRDGQGKKVPGLVPAKWTLAGATSVLPKGPIILPKSILAEVNSVDVDGTSRSDFSATNHSIEEFGFESNRYIILKDAVKGGHI